MCEVGFEISDASFLGQTLGAFEAQPESSKAQAFEDFAKAKRAGLHAQDLPADSGADLGLANLACLGHASGREACILSAPRIDRTLARFDAPIDARLSELALAAPPALQALRAQRSAPTSKEAPKDGASQEDGAAAKFSKADVRLLRAGDALERKDPRLSRLRDARESFLADAVHQARDGIVQEVLRAGSAVLVVGPNKLWKTGSTLGPTQNRRFHRLPHARRTEPIRIKAEAASILAFCVEESYTSRTSFAAGEPLATLGARPAAPSKSGGPVRPTSGEDSKNSRRAQAPPPSPERGQGLLAQASDAHPKAGLRRVLGARSGPPVEEAARRLERSLQHPSKSHAGVLAVGLGGHVPEPELPAAWALGGGPSGLPPRLT